MFTAAIDYVANGGSLIMVLEGPGGMRWATVSHDKHDDFVVIRISLP
jgi:hypothetical protein